MSIAEGLAERIADLAAGSRRPFVVAIDGRSSAGKTTLARELGSILAATVIEGDDFYSGGHEIEWEQMTPAERSLYCIDWRRQRSVLRQLRDRRQAIWHPYDWSATDARRSLSPITATPTEVVILEGVYSARPELHEYVDLTVLLDTPDRERERRFNTRPRETAWTSSEDDRRRWAALFGASEDYYFEHVMPSDRFDETVEFLQPHPSGELPA